jgi:hypothetical protein
VSRRLSLSLSIGLPAVVVSAAAISLVGFLRTGEWSWLGDVIRPLGLALLAILVFQGRAWARWALVVWIGLSSIAFLILSFTVGGSLLWRVAIGGVALLYIWVVIELAKADMLGPPVKDV